MSSVPERLQRISEHYDHETGAYDEGYSTPTCKAEDAMVAGLLGQFVGGKVLDIGAGSGLLCEIMEIDNYTGVELSPNMTRQAKGKFPDKSFIVADMHHLPFAQDSFDSAISLYGPLSYSLAPEELLSEIMRVVRPGGYIALMPYTLRVGHNLEIGGYSTAVEKGIEKIFYTGEMLKKLMSSLDDVQVHGINYFLNTYTRFAREMNLDDDQAPKASDLHTSFLEREKNWQDVLPAEFARHMIGIGRKPVS